MEKAKDAKSEATNKKTTEKQKTNQVKNSEELNINTTSAPSTVPPPSPPANQDFLGKVLMEILIQLKEIRGIGIGSTLPVSHQSGQAEARLLKPTDKIEDLLKLLER